MQKQRQGLSPAGEQLLLNKIRLERIQRYQALQEQINAAYTAGLCELLNENVDSERFTAIMQET